MNTLTTKTKSVGFFKEALEYGIDFAGELGTISGGFRRKLAPHSCMILKITPREMPHGGFGCSRHL